jgi:hypothetical protein
MKILKDIKFENAILISSMFSPRQLLRTDLDQYAIIQFEPRLTVWGFESKLFSRLLEAIGESITDIEIDSATSVEGAEISGFRMLLESGRHFIVNSNGDFYEVQQVELVSSGSPTAIAAYEQWSLKEGYPFDRMMVTNACAVHLDCIQSTAPISDVLSRIWFDYTQLNRENGSRVLEHQSFSSEFGSFAALELLCGRVVFYSPEFEPIDDSDADDECL